jgi:hypothetical protein
MPESQPFDPTLLAYDLSVLAPDGRLLHLPRGGLVVQESPGELATVMRCRLPDVMTTEGAMAGLVPCGTPYYVNVAERGPTGPALASPTTSWGASWDPQSGGTVGGVVAGGQLREVTRGTIVRIARRADSAEIEVEGSDNLATLLEHDMDLHVEAGTPAREAVSGLFEQWGVPMGDFAGPDVELPEKSYRGERAAAILDDILGQGPRQGAGWFLLRALGDRVDVVGAGGNEPTYWLRPGQGAGVSAYSIDISNMVGNVVIKTEVRAESSGEEADGEDIGGTPPDAQESSADGAPDFGGATRIIVRDEKTTDEIARLEAASAIAEHGFPDQSFEHQTFDIPYVHKWDRIRITDRLLDGYFLVSGVSHDASQARMHLQLITPQDFERQALQMTLTAQLQALRGEQRATPAELALGTGPAVAGGGDCFNRQAPGFQQATDWTCSAASLAHVLQMCWISATEQGIVDRLGAGISSAVGLQDASGTQLRRILGEEGIQSSAQSVGSGGFDQALSIFRGAVGCMSGAAWYHWTAVRGASGDSLSLMNPAPGYRGVDQTMSRADFERLGPWNLVYVTACPPGARR